MRVWLSLVLTLIMLPTSHADTLSFDCKFSLSASPKGLKKESSPFVLNLVTDTNAKKSYMIGSNGSSEVHAIPNNNGVSFLEITSTGNVMVTSVNNSGEAIHSRNTMMNNEIIPSQYYGKCVVK